MHAGRATALALAALLALAPLAAAAPRGGQGNKDNQGDQGNRGDKKDDQGKNHELSAPPLRITVATPDRPAAPQPPAVTVTGNGGGDRPTATVTAVTPAGTIATGNGNNPAQLGGSFVPTGPTGNTGAAGGTAGATTPAGTTTAGAGTTPADSGMAANNGVSSGLGMGTGGGSVTINTVTNQVVQSAPTDGPNSIKYRFTSGGTYVPGFSPSGGVVSVPQGYALPYLNGGESNPPAQPSAAASPPAQNLLPDRPISSSEAVEGLIAAVPEQVEANLRRYSFNDAAKLLARGDRRQLRTMVIDSPVATGNQNLLTKFLRSAGLIQRFHVVVGVIPRKNMILIGFKSSEED